MQQEMDFIFNCILVDNDIQASIISKKSNRGVNVFNNVIDI